MDIKQLTERLLQAMRHALCDIVMEYRLLTAPLCEAPIHHLEAAMHSAPPSPALGPGSYHSLSKTLCPIAKCAFCFTKLLE